MGILRKVYLYIFFLLILIDISCWPTRDLKNFTLYGETTEVDTNKLKINGVYYTLQKSENKSRVKCFVLYENGTYLDLTSCEINSNIESAIDSLISNFNAHQKMYSTEYISIWGAFKIMEDTLLIQRYHSSIMPKPGIITFTSKVFNYKMKILNDTTLIEGSVDDESKSIFEEYYLFKTNRKPDSTNLFMTNKRVKRKLDKLNEKRK